MTDDTNLTIAPLANVSDVHWRIDSKAYDRPSSPTGHVARFVPYLDATTIARLFDQWVGPMNWTDSYEPRTLANVPVLACTISVTWGGVTTSKTDVGMSPGGADEMVGKGIVSDAFKRCGCIKWGVGRNVYALPTPWLPVGVNSQGKPVQNAESTKAIEQYLSEAGLT